MTIGVLELALLGSSTVTTIPRAILGVSAIGILLLLFSWPRWWWVPLLVVVEGVTHTALARGLGHTAEMFIRHWWMNIIGINIYPWFILILFTLGVEIYLQVRKPFYS